MKFVTALALLVASTNAFTAPHTTTALRPTATTSLSSATAAGADAVEAPSPLSPLTLWGDEISDIRQVQRELRRSELPEFAPEIRAADLGLSAGDTAAQLRYLQDHAAELKEKMQRHGAIVFRGFDLMKTQDGFQQFYRTVGMKTCLDPLHSVSARPTVDGKKNSPVYEAVNKESRKNFFIGTYEDDVVRWSQTRTLVYSLVVSLVSFFPLHRTSPCNTILRLDVLHRHAQ